jgi:O-methyltransferase
MPLPETRIQELNDAARDSEELLVRLRRNKAVTRTYLPRPAPVEIGPEAVVELHDFAAKTIGDVPVLYLEFGVAGGKSIRAMAERFTHRDARFFGFDSFEGIPEDWGGKPRGSFSMKGKAPVFPDKRIQPVQGWFQDSVPGFLQTLKTKPSTPVLVHYDADLYSSTLFLLCALWPYIPDYYFLFDEFMSEEIIALDDFSVAFPVDIEFLCQTNAGRMPSRVFGRVRRVQAAKRYAAAPAS